MWEPQADTGAQPSADTVYSVTVSNVGIGGQARAFTYEVVAFDPAAP